ncbi:MAG: IS66 family transposase [Opitutaceae bacterium]|nr:IS66 family transposase [Cytophagales bacterium]
MVAKIATLEAELAVYKNKKNSNNSHIPPSQDQNRLKRNQSLREKTTKKPGGQLGHMGTTLEFNTPIDEVVEYTLNYCNNCGNDLSEVVETLIETRKVIDIPVIAPVYIEHRIYRKVCSCGKCMESEFPRHVAASLQYGPNVESLVGYLHGRQYLPYKRMKELFTDVMNLPISVGGINSVLERITKKALPWYEQIKKRISQSTFVGTDETSVKVNGSNDWIWTWQNGDLTFIVHSDNRGGRTIEKHFPDGLPHTGLVHDRYACHFNCEAQYHQICMAHLLRDLKYITQLYEGKCEWAIQMKTLISEALELKRVMTLIQYDQPNDKRSNLVTRLEHLLHSTLQEEHSKAKTLLKNLVKHQQSILNFLCHPQLPPDNNGSERAIRNIKVKQKISGQFKSEHGADCFATIRSIIDTTIKSGQNVLATLRLIAIYGAE